MPSLRMGRTRARFSMRWSNRRRSSPTWQQVCCCFAWRAAIRRGGRWVLQSGCSNIFVRRVPDSTMFSAIAALLLTSDSMHFMQSRISTPEGIVVVFAAAAVFLRIEVVAVAGSRRWLLAVSPGERERIMVARAGASKRII